MCCVLLIAPNLRQAAALIIAALLARIIVWMLSDSLHWLSLPSKLATYWWIEQFLKIQNQS